METVSKNTAYEKIPGMLPVIPTMDVVVFPHTIVPLLVLDERIINGINKTLEESKMVLLLAAKNQDGTNQEAIGTQDLYTTGTVASIMRLVKIPEGGIKILVQGVARAQAKDIITDGNILQAQVEPLELDENNPDELQAHVCNIKELAEQMASSGQSFSPDFHIILSKIRDPEKVIDFVLSHLNISVDQAQALLEKNNQADLLTALYQELLREMEVSQVQEKIRVQARESMNKSQKEYYLREQLKVIKKELGDDDTEDIAKMREQLEALPVSEEVRSEVTRQINRLEKMAPDSMEATVTRNYLDWVFGMPWGIETVDNLDINNAQKVLDEDHYGLKEIKDRILDFISVRNLKQDGHTPILCFVGPPGTGKTSLGKSIARSLGRKYIRVALGGAKDEAEIRGHRRTYVGAMPGRLIQGIRKAGSCNPVIIIDELDKIGADFRGDPSAALLEVLDPHQNASFYDNYLGVPFDLSKTIFIATANTLDTISPPLLDRMEVISLSGYTVEEKVRIAQNHIVQRAITDVGLEERSFAIDDKICQDLIERFTRESGVRQLERIIRKLASKAARCFVQEHKIPKFTKKNIEQYLGPRKFIDTHEMLESQVGIANGLAWTAYGGEMMKIEAILIPGNGKLLLTGQLGDVMKESAQAAMTYARAHAKEFGLEPKNFSEHDLHIHVPAGAVPKDGPSAGITMLTCILSAVTQRPIDATYAMTGELNLRGEVMPIGGVKEKILAAKRNGITHILLPDQNKNDLIGLDDVVKGIDIILVRHADEVIHKILLTKQNIIIPKKKRAVSRAKA